MARNADPFRPHAFTIIELIVAIAVASLLMFMVNSLFMHTSRAVQVGSRTGDILVESESIADHVQRDADRMNGPNADNAAMPDFDTQPPGVLVIVNRLYDNAEITLNNIDFPNDRAPAPVVIRSDQLAFIIAAEDGEPTLQALTPQDDTRYDNTNRATFARIWYGHLLPGGTSSLTDGGPANRWILGRQQLLLHDGTPDPLVGVYADRAAYNAPTTVPAGSYPDPGFLYEGMTDVADQALYDTSDPTETESLIGSLSDPLAPTEYGEKALALTYYDQAEERLRTEPQPQIGAGYMESWQLAQMHAILAMGVSDFIVEFAGDYRTGEGTSGAIASDGEIDRDDDGYIMWYSYYYNNPYDPGESNYARNAAGVLEYDPTLPRSYNAFALTGVFQLIDGSAPSPHFDDGSDPGSIVATADNANAAFVFRHDDDDAADSNWPHMLRIRYRLHDRRGMVLSSHRFDEATNASITLPGQWFEQVIRVPRP